MVEFVKRPSLRDVCRELTHPHTRDGVRCDSILNDLAMLVMPSQSLLRDGAGSMGKRVGSPAPWFAPAAELLDEIDRGATRWELEARHTLGVAATVGGLTADALEALPGLVAILADKGHPLGIREAASGTVSDGLIETQVREWHRRALVVLGDVAPLERLPTVSNPDHPSNGGRPRIGPACWSCAHVTCQRIASSRRRSLSWPCPCCNRDTLRRDPASGVVVCIHSTCTDDEGRRPSWHVTAFDEAARSPWGDE